MKIIALFSLLLVTIFDKAQSQAPAPVTTKAPVLPPSSLPVCAPTLPCITGLVLIDAENDAVIQNLTNGDAIFITDTLTSIAIVANATKPATYQVHFVLDGVSYRNESISPYAMNGDTQQGTNFNPWPYTLGPHTLSVTALNTNGTLISPTYTVSFTVSQESHFAHAVTGGPYSVVDTDGDNLATVALDGTGSHTHRFPGSLVSYSWLDDGVQFSTVISPTHQFAVGVHNIMLVVLDSGGSLSNDTSTVTVLPSSIPDIADLNPNAGNIAGGYPVEITGSGFATLDPSDIVVSFNGVNLTGSDIQIIDAITIVVMAPANPLPATKLVTVTTPEGTSAPKTFLYTDSNLPNVTFTQGDVLTGISGPTAVAFGPDHKLYVGTQSGELYKLTLNETYHIVDMVGPSYILNNIYGGWRSILGMSFHPGNTSIDNPEVYVSHSQLFHGQYDGYVGVISKVGGVNLTDHIEVISGLPVSAHDHGVNGIDFGDGGELYIVLGGNTNGGIPGRLTKPVYQDEKQFSGACLIAHLYQPDFNGTLYYDANSHYPGDDVEVFGHGLRNSFDVVYHSNGKLYATDNGPNINFGAMSTNCTATMSDIEEPDRIHVILKDRYYGHPNRLRAQLYNDPRQCKWRSRSEPSDSEYTAPIAHVASSTNGIIEFQTAHFASQLRGQLFVLKHNSRTSYSIKLSASGLASIQIEERGQGGLDLTQGPDGTLFVAHHGQDKVYYKKPDEPVWGDLRVLSCFPRRGPLSGGSRFHVYGQGLNIGGVPEVTVGNQPCTGVTVISSSEIECTLPPAIVPFHASIVVTSGSFSGVLPEVYRYATFQGGPQPALDPVTSNWLAVTTPTNPIPNHESCFVMGNNGKGYLLGGRSWQKICEYDPATQNWKCTRRKPPIKFHHAQCVVVGDKIWVPFAWTGNPGSETNVPLMYIYDIGTNTWSTRQGLPVGRQRAAGAAQYFNGFIYVSHGAAPENNGSNSVSLFDRYDIANNQWTALPDAQFPRDHTGAAIVKGTWFCVAGGRNSGDPDMFNAVILQTECYDLLDGVNGTWTTKANIPQGRAGSAYGTTCDGKLIVAGGEGFGQAWKNVDVFDGETWMPFPDMTTARHSTGLAVSCNCGIQVHITVGRPCQGGGRACSTTLNTTETLFPKGVNVNCL